jgi:hypothetical protein
MGQVVITPKEAQTIDKALRLLRDRHYSSYHNSKNPEGEVAQKHKAEAHELDIFRSTIVREANK